MGRGSTELLGLDLSRSTLPFSEVVEQMDSQFPKHKVLFAIQVYEKLHARSLNELQIRFNWSELRIYDINEEGRNHGILLGTKGSLNNNDRTQIKLVGGPRAAAEGDAKATTVLARSTRIRKAVDFLYVPQVFPVVILSAAKDLLFSCAMRRRLERLTSLDLPAPHS